MKDFGIRGDYPEPDDYDLPSRVVLWFKNDDNADVAIALTTYVHDLLKAGDDDWAFAQFKRAFMGIYE